MVASLDARAKGIIDGAIDLRGAERRAFLDRSCTGDAELRDRVERLLAAVEKEDAFLSGPTMGADAGAGPPAGAERPGASIGPYKLLELIGEGGFGSVFMAEQTEPVRRRVALKIIKLGMDTRAVVARFEQERQALALMDHPHIAKVLDAGATATGRPYFVMELVKGEPITSFCDRASLSIPERLELFTQVCRAVQHAHTKGVIHRDIKPSNVLVSEQDGRPMCRVIDFGIAKATLGPLTEKTLFTEFRTLIGTPEYMSPEQALGGLDIDTRTDVYSLGVMLYELLAGVTPLDPARLRSAAFDEMQRIIREVDPPAPSTRISRARETIASVAALRRTEPGRLRSIVRGELDWIVMRALEKDRVRRYESVGNFAGDVERYLAGEPVQAAPPSRVYRFRKFVRRHRLAVGAGVAVAGALSVGLGAALWQAGVAARERDAARASARAAIDARSEAEARRVETEEIAAFQEAQLSGINPEQMGGRIRAAFLADAQAGMERAGVPPAQIEERRKSLEAMLDDANPTNVAVRTLDENIFSTALKTADDQFKDRPLTRARILQTLADTMRGLGMLDQATAPQQEALSIRRRLLGDRHVDTLNSLGSDGLLMLSKGQLPEAEQAFRETRTGLGALGPDQRGVLNATSNLALSLQMQGKIAEARQTYRDLIEECRRALGREDRDTLQSMENLAGLLVDSGDPAGAEPLFRQVLEGRQHALGSDHPDLLMSFNNLALVLEKTGRPAEAAPLYREAMERSRRIHGEDHPDTFLYMGNLGYLLASQGRLAEAEPLTRGALEGRRRVLGENSWETMYSINNMGLLLQSQGNFPEAEKYLRDALERRRATRGNDHTETLDSLSNLGRLLLARHEPEQAELLFREALAGRERNFGKSNPVVAGSRIDLGESLGAQGKWADAEGTLLHAAQTIEETDAPDSASRTRCVKALISLYETRDAAEPGKGYDAKAAEWKGRLDTPELPGRDPKSEGRK